MIKRKIVFLCFLLLIVSMTACSESTGLTNRDLVFEVNGESFELDSDVAAFLAYFGDDYDYSEAPSCMFDGMDKMYAYDGIEVYTYPSENGKDLIDEILILSPDYATNRGIRVGDSKEALVKAYGDDYTDEGGFIRYAINPDDPKSRCLYFVIVNDMIESISYYSASNM